MERTVGRRARGAALAVAVLVGMTGCQRGHPVQTLDLAGGEAELALPELAEALDGVRIVLLGENGHGVGEFTRAKVRLIEWLHREHGFDLVVFESGLFECGRAWERVRELEPAEALRGCLSYPFEHAELLPLFRTFRETADGPRPLAFGGMDLQAQGFDSGERPETAARWLTTVDPELARRVAASDSALYLVPDSGGAGGEVYRLAHGAAPELLADYRAAAEATEGLPRWTFRLAEGWVERLALRGALEAEGGDQVPGRYYELRDEWMARAVAAHADSLGAPRKVVVWLHNDHARYGRFPIGGDSIRSTGGYLREWYGDQVLSVGLFLGRGTVADNSRRPREVVPLPAGALEGFLGRAPGSYLVLRGNADPGVREWAAASHPYLRMGLDTLEMTPAREFDALFYIDSVGVPDYRVR